MEKYLKNSFMWLHLTDVNRQWAFCASLRIPSIFRRRVGALTFTWTTFHKANTVREIKDERRKSAVGSQKQRHSLYSTFVFYTFLVFENMLKRTVYLLRGDFIDFAEFEAHIWKSHFEKSQLQFYYSMKLKIHLWEVNYFSFTFL